MEIIVNSSLLVQLDEEQAAKLVKNSVYISALTECDDYQDTVDLTNLEICYDEGSLYFELYRVDNLFKVVNKDRFIKLNRTVVGVYILAYRLDDEYIMDRVHEYIQHLVDMDDSTNIIESLSSYHVDIQIVYNICRNVPFLAYLLFSPYIKLHDCHQDYFWHEYEVPYPIYINIHHLKQDDNGYMTGPLHAMMIYKITNGKFGEYPYNKHVPKDIIEICNDKYLHMPWQFYFKYKFKDINISSDILPEDDFTDWIGSYPGDLPPHRLLAVVIAINDMRKTTNDYYRSHTHIPYPRHNVEIMEIMKKILDDYPDTISYTHTGPGGPTGPIGYGVEPQQCQILSCPTNKRYRDSVLAEAKKISDLTDEELDYTR